VTIISEYMLYFILDRRGATRNDELHPAITDTPAVQQAMVQALREKSVELLVLKHIFADDTLDRMKSEYRLNLPMVGATELDVFIRDNYQIAERFGPYEVWLRRR
jgi:hypothetical protein